MSSGWWTRTVEPTQQPITLADAKAQTRIVGDDSNGLLQSYIASATDEAEQTLGYGLLMQTYKYALEEWYESIPLPMCRVLQSVDSVKYYDTDGTLQTLSSTYYTTDTTARPVRLVRAANQYWPSLQPDRQAAKVEITYTVGWTTPADVPERIKQGIRMRVAAFDHDRDGADMATSAQGWTRCWYDAIAHIDPCESED